MYKSASPEEKHIHQADKIKQTRQIEKKKDQRHKGNTEKMYIKCQNEECCCAKNIPFKMPFSGLVIILFHFILSSFLLHIVNYGHHYYNVTFFHFIHCDKIHISIKFQESDNRVSPYKNKNQWMPRIP